MTAVALSGCGNTNSDVVVMNTTASRVSGGATTGFSIDLTATGSGSLVSYSLASSGQQVVTSTMSLAPGLGPTAVAVDPTNGTVYVGGTVPISGYAVPVVVSYPAGTTDGSHPTRLLIGDGSPATFDEPTSMAVDENGLLYVASSTMDQGTVAVYSTTANYQDAPLRAISGASTGLYEPTQVAVDAGGNIYVANDFQDYAGNVVIFPPTANGNVAPARAITDDFHIFTGVAPDSKGNVFVVAGSFIQGSHYVSAPFIAEYVPGQSGPDHPKFTLSGSSTQLTNAGTMEIDSKDNMYVKTETATDATANQQILGYGPGVTGNVPPDFVMTGAPTQTHLVHFAIH